MTIPTYTAAKDVFLLALAERYANYNSNDELRSARDAASDLIAEAERRNPYKHPDTCERDPSPDEYFLNVPISDQIVMLTRERDEALAKLKRYEEPSYKWRPGDQAIALEDLDSFGRREITKDKRYIVCGVRIDENNGCEYLKVLGEDNKGHELISKLFMRSAAL